MFFLFKAIAQLDEVISAGLLVMPRLTSFNDKIILQGDKSSKIIQQANYLANIASFGESLFSNIALLKYIDLVKAKLMVHYKKSFAITELEPKLFDDLIWRNFFSKSLSYNDYEMIFSKKMYLSDLNRASIATCALKPKMTIKLDTTGWDFILFQDARPVSVNPGTRKLIRYHDAIPITDGDVTSLRTPQLHSGGLIKCVRDSYFICDSQATRDALHAITDLPEENSTVIPCSLMATYKKSENKNILNSIFINRLSNLAADDKKLDSIRAGLMNNIQFPYILSLATLEPRKNYISLIRAWEQLRLHKNIPHKLVIVGNSGWKYEEIVKTMRPHIEQGNILHLSGIPLEEMPYLFSHASAFVFPSYNEGFGLPPLEAMQCECPTIVSDIKVHREVMGDASLYCNPYDIQSIADAIERLISSSEAEHLRAQLIAKGLAKVQLYTPEKVGDQWLEFFKKLKPIK